MSYASIRRQAFEDAAQQHGLSLVEQAVLLRLLLLADWRTGIYRCTQTGLAEAFGIQRHNLRPKLDRLTEAGLIDCYFPRGHDGAVRVLAYLDLVHIAPSQEPKQSLRKDRKRNIRDVLRAPAIRTDSVQHRDRIGTSEQDPPVLSLEAPAPTEVVALLDDHELGASEQPARLVHTAGTELLASPRCVPSVPRIDVGANGSGEPSPAGHERDPRARSNPAANPPNEETQR